MLQNVQSALTKKPLLEGAFKTTGDQLSTTLITVNSPEKATKQTPSNAMRDYRGDIEIGQVEERAQPLLLKAPALPAAPSRKPAPDPRQHSETVWPGHRVIAQKFHRLQ